jgi:SAM-dependent methyltransferase
VTVAGVDELGFDPGREERELREYLGEQFELDRLWHYEQQLEEEFAQALSERSFYRESRAYLYNLTAFAMSGTKLPYLHALVQRVRPSARLLDYGCGIGSDGLLLLEVGYQVEFAEFDNPSAEYLRWRLARRGLEAPIHDLDGAVPGGFDAVFAFDVIEHVEQPFVFLTEMERRGRLIEVNFLEHGGHEQSLHRELPIDWLLRHAAEHRLRYYRVLHGRSHLVMYDSELASRPVRLLNRVRLAGGRERQRLAKAWRRLPRGARRATPQ